MRGCWFYQKASNIVVLFDESLSEYGSSGDCRLQIGILSYRKISLVRKYVTVYEAQLIVPVRVTSKFDYCDSLLNGLPKYLIKQLLRLQNAAALVVTVHQSSAILHVFLKIPICFRFNSE